MNVSANHRELKFVQNVLKSQRSNFCCCFASNALNDLSHSEDLALTSWKWGLSKRSHGQCFRVSGRLKRWRSCTMVGKASVSEVDK